MPVFQLPPVRPGMVRSHDDKSRDPYLSRVAMQRARDEMQRERDGEKLAAVAGEKPPTPSTATPSAFTEQEVESLKALAQAGPAILRALQPNADEQGSPNHQPKVASADARRPISLNDRFHQRAANACHGKATSTDGRRRRIGEGAYTAFRGGNGAA